MERRFGALALLVFSLAKLPVVASAQTTQSGSIAGTVRDPSGAVLPGVTVEAMSPALIERSRSAVTDSQGVYRLVDLRPGTYTVTFTLQGFSSLRREGIEVSVGFTATVNADLAVGSIEETVTVSGATPVVDVQNIIQQRLISREVRDALPLPSNSGAYVAVIPGAVQSASNQDVGGNMGENRQQFTVHGSRTADFQQLRDGQYFGTMVAAGNFMSSVNPTTVQEVSVLTAGGLTAESETGGAQINVIPRDGGNAFHGAVNANFSHRNLQSNNLDDSLRARGATTAPFIKQSYEIAGGLGGPLRRDRLWFFGSARRWVLQSYQPGNYFNATQGTMFYTPDFDRPAYENNFYNEQTLRLTWQAAARHKFAGMVSTERNCNCFFAIQNGTFAPEATGDDLYWPNWRTQVSWNHTASDKLLFEAGGTVVEGLIVRRLTGGSYDDISILDTSRNYRYGSAGSSITNFTQAWGERASAFGQFNQRFTMTYVTGSHSFKTGIQARRGHQELELFIRPNLSYTFRGTVPQSVTYFAGPYGSKAAQQTIALFAQDQWTIDRLTLNLGARFDYLNGWIPAIHLPAGTFVPERDFAKQENVLNWKDVSPRLGAAFDLFGNGRTALKGFIGRYVVFQNNGGLLTGSSAVNAMVTSSTRQWSDANNDYVPQDSELGPHSASDFGRLRINTRYDDDLMHGWHRREFSWQGSVSIQHEVRPGLAVNVGYFRTWYGNFSVTDNLNVTPDDYDEYCITAPTDARLPTSSERICGLFDIDPSRFGSIDNLVTRASNFGERHEIFNGIDVTMDARFGNGGQISGGMSTGSTLTDDCAVQIDSPQRRFCRVQTPWSAGLQFKFSGLYQLPWNLRVSGTYQNIAGIPTTASYVVSNAQIAPSLGRNLGACGTRPTCTATATVDLIEPSSLYTEGRNNQLNFRFSRRFSVRGASVEPQIDFHNVLNANQVLVMTTRYGDAWQNVAGTGVLAPRVVRIGVQVNF